MDISEKQDLHMSCQISCLPLIAQPIRSIERIWQFRNRLQRFLKRRLIYCKNRLLRRNKTQASIFNKATNASLSVSIKAGDLVQVRSREEVQATLNQWNHLKGCAFLEEMWHYCGSMQTVMKRVEQFLDERDYLIKRSRGLVILNGVICEGTKDFGRCDRSCYFFWREEWLKKIE